MRLNVLVAALLMTVGVAQTEIGEPLSNGVLSYIEDLPEIGTSEGIYRATPFVEVIDTEALEVCRDQGFDAEGCPEFEFSIPFLPKISATDVETEIVDAWLRFETRSYYNSLLEIGAIPGLVTCTTGLGVVDLIWYFYTDELFFPADDFCDGHEEEIIPSCFLECMVPTASCPMAPGACPGCIARQLVKAETRKYTDYYLDYSTDVAEALLVNMPTALMWEGPTFLQGGGTLLAPIAGAEFPTSLIDFATDAMTDDPRALSYFLQSGAYSDICQPVMPRQILNLLRRIPAVDSDDPNLPGLPALELLKRDLANRESAGATYKRFPYFWQGADSIYPQYTRDGQDIVASTNPADYVPNPDEYDEGEANQPVTDADGNIIDLPDIPKGITETLENIDLANLPEGVAEAIAGGIGDIGISEGIASAILGEGEASLESTSLPLVHSCFGYATFFQVYQELDTILSLYRPIQRPASCLTATPPFVGVTVAPIIPIPWSFVGQRFHTDWNAVPEGYDIPRVQGTPSYFLPEGE